MENLTIEAISYIVKNWGSTPVSDLAHRLKIPSRTFDNVIRKLKDGGLLPERKPRVFGQNNEIEITKKDEIRFYKKVFETKPKKVFPNADQIKAIAREYGAKGPIKLAKELGLTRIQVIQIAFWLRRAYGLKIPYQNKSRMENIANELEKENPELF